MGSRWRQALHLGRKIRTVFAGAPVGRWVPGPARFLHATAVSCYSLRGPGKGSSQGRGTGGGGGDYGSDGGDEDDEEDEEEDEEEDPDEDELEDEQLLESALPPLPFGHQNVLVVHPAIKRGPSRPRLTTGGTRLAQHRGARK